MAIRGLKLGFRVWVNVMVMVQVRVPELGNALCQRSVPTKAAIQERLSILLVF